MRNYVAAAVLGFCMLLALCACAKQSAFDMKSVAEFYANVQSASATAQIETNTGVLANYKIEYSRQGDRSQVSITEPAALAGITAEISADMALVTYADSTSFECLLPEYFGYTPISALDGVMRDLATALIGNYNFEKRGEQKTVALTYTQDLAGVAGEKRIWLDAQTLLPLYAEIYLDGDMVMSLTIQNFKKG